MKTIEGHTPAPWFIDRAPNGYMLRGPLPDDAPDDAAAWRKAIAILLSPEDRELLLMAPDLAAENARLRDRNADLLQALSTVRDDILDARDKRGYFKDGRSPERAAQAADRARALLDRADDRETGPGTEAPTSRVPTGNKVLAEELLGELKRLRAFIDRNATPYHPDSYLVNGEDAHLEITDTLILAGEHAKDDKLCKHYMLRTVPEEKRKLALSCGFVPLADETGQHKLWHLLHPKGPLSDMPKDKIEGWLLQECIAWEIFVADLWGGTVG